MRSKIRASQTQRGQEREKYGSWTCKPNSVRRIAPEARSSLWATHRCVALAPTAWPHPLGGDGDFHEMDGIHRMRDSLGGAGGRGSVGETQNRTATAAGRQTFGRKIVTYALSNPIKVNA